MAYLSVYEYVLLSAAGAPPGKRVAGIDVSGGDYDGGLGVLPRPHDGRVRHPDRRLHGPPLRRRPVLRPGQEPMWPVRNEERRKCLDTLAMIRRHGGSQRFWVGEKGWGLGITLIR